MVKQIKSCEITKNNPSSKEKKEVCINKSILNDPNPKSKSENCEALPKITKYFNGLLINDNFYSYSEKKNLELLKMLENNEFDREILKINDDFANILVEERNENYKDLNEKVGIEFIPKRSKTHINELEGQMGDLKMSLKEIDESKNIKICFELPESIIFDDQNIIKFRVNYFEQCSTVSINEERKIKEAIEYFSKLIGRPVYFKRRGKIVNNESLVSELKQTMVELFVVET